MISHSYIEILMNLERLPESSKLRQLFATCQMNHEIARTICSDGGIIIECLECYFHHVLTPEEEEVLLEEDALLSSQTQIL